MFIARTRKWKKEMQNKKSKLTAAFFIERGKQYCLS